MRWFWRKRGRNTISSTRVLVSAVGDSDTLVSAAALDADIYSRHYGDVTSTPAPDGDFLVDTIKAGAFDVVHVLASVNADGTIGRRPVGQVLETCRETNVKLVFFASDNPADVYISHVRRGNFNLVMTLERRGEYFAAFLDSLLSKMAAGKTMPVVWVGLAPQTQGAPEHDTLPRCIFDANRGDIVLLK